MSLFRRPSSTVTTAPVVDRTAGVTWDEMRSMGLTWDQYIRVVGDSGRASETTSGTAAGALQRAVIYRCVNKIAGTVSTFPVSVRRGRETLPTLPTVIDRPSTLWRARSPWMHSVVASMLLRGNAFGLVDDASMARRGYPSWCELIDADRVTWTAAKGWHLDGQPIDEYPLGPLWHVPLHVLPGSPVGLNPISYARKTIFANAVAQEFSSDFFTAGGHPTVLLQPQSDPGYDGARKHKQAFVDATRAREPVVLPQSIVVTPMKIDPKDSQFIELMKFTDEQLCGFFGVDPRSIGIQASGQSMTYSNREQVKQDELQDSMMVAIVRLQEAMSDLLPRPQVVRLSYAGLLRSDLAARYDSYLKSAQYEQITGKPIVTNGEIREWEDLPDLSETDWQPPITPEVTP